MINSLPYNDLDLLSEYMKYYINRICVYYSLSCGNHKNTSMSILTFDEYKAVKSTNNITTTNRTVPIIFGNDSKSTYTHSNQ